MNNLGPVVLYLLRDQQWNRDRDNDCFLAVAGDVPHLFGC